MRDELFGCLLKLQNLQERCQNSRKLILVIVAIALLLDNMLLTTIVPIFPTYLYKLNHPNETVDEDAAPITGTSPAPSTSTTSTTAQAPHSRRFTLPHYGQPKGGGGAVTGGGRQIEVVGTGPNCTCLCNVDDCYPSYPPLPETDDSRAGEDGRQSNDTRLLWLASPRQRPYASTEATTTVDSHKPHAMNHEDLKKENVELGLMYGAKAFVQLVTNPFIGPLTHRIGYSIPMFAGFVIMFLSTVIFAFGNSYTVMFVARALQGVGSSCSSVSGMGMLAECYPDDKERGNAMGLALGGLALGVLIGPAFGGIMYQYFNKTAPFLVLALLALGDGLLQLLVLKPKVRPQERKAPTLRELMQDPYIVGAAGAITFANMGIGMLEPSLPIWMMGRMNSTKIEQGAVFLPASISYLVGTNLFGPLGHYIGRSLSSFLGLLLSGLSLIFVPTATSLSHLILPTAGLGFAIGMVDSSMMPELGFLVDLRHSNVYGSVYSIGDVAFCLGFFIGPVLSGPLVQNIGFDSMLYGMAAINFLYAPLMYFLKDPPARPEEMRNLINDPKSMSFTQFKNEEEEINSLTVTDPWKAPPVQNQQQ